MTNNTTTSIDHGYTSRCETGNDAITTLSDTNVAPAETEPPQQGASFSGTCYTNDIRGIQLSIIRTKMSQANDYGLDFVTLFPALKITLVCIVAICVFSAIAVGHVSTRFVENDSYIKPYLTPAGSRTPLGILEITDLGLG